MKHSGYTTTKIAIPTPQWEMPALLFRPQNARNAPGVLWIHGGGYMTGMPGMVYITRALSLVQKFGAVVLSPKYRLSARARYPGALIDCRYALLYLRDHAEELGVDAERIMVGGESAGGGLTAALCIDCRNRGDVGIAFQMPLYPMLDDRDTDSSRDNHAFMWNTPLNHLGWHAYLGGNYGHDVPPTAAPARETDYRGLPPAYTFVGSREPFYCETVRYIENLRAAGVEANLDVYDTSVHAFDIMLPNSALAKTACAEFERQFKYAAEHYRARQP